MSRRKIKILLIVLAVLLTSVGVTYMFSFSKIYNLERAGFPVGEVISKMEDEIFPMQKFFLIDDSLIFVERTGFANDYSFHHVLLDKEQKELCAYADNIAGSKSRCNDDSRKDIFETIINNLDKKDLGLKGHKVELIYTKKKMMGLFIKLITFFSNTKRSE